MRVFVTGGTGLIGQAIVKALSAAGHDVTGLARSEKSADTLKNAGATPLHGNLTAPKEWVGDALTHGAIIHAAATFEADMGDVDDRFISALIETAPGVLQDRKLPFLYTGGSWLYPESSVIPLTERHVLDPLPKFAWMLDSIEQIHAHSFFLLTVIHPALVVDQGRGLIADYARELMDDGKITMIGGKDIHFPLVHAKDLANLYLRALDHGGSGLLLNASAFKSATSLEIAELVAKKCNKSLNIEVISVEAAQKKHGRWIAGYGRSQRMEADRARDLLDWSPDFITIEDLVDDCLKNLV